MIQHRLPSQPGTGAGSKLPGSIAENLAKKKIPKLDALRAISALIVVIYHFGINVFPASAGVMAFFVISGFLITWLLLAEFEKTGTISLRDFYIRRTFRIFPAFYVFWFVTVGLLLLKHGHIIWQQAIATFLYVGNYYQGLNGYPETGLSHSWSLGVEEQYYLIWPALFVILARNRKRLLWGTLAGILLVWIYRSILQLAGTPEEYLYTAFETRIDNLLVGCALAISLKFGYFTRLWNIVCARSWYMWLTAIGLALSITASYHLGFTYRYIVGYTIEPVLVAVLLAQLLATSDRRLAWMDSAPVVYLGTISYSTYLYHKLAGAAVTTAIGRHAPVAAVFVLGVLLTYVAASVSYYGVERPFLRLRDRLGRRRAQASISPVLSERPLRVS